MPHPKKREIECLLNQQTLVDLIIAHLHNVGFIRNTEEVTEVYFKDIVDNCFALTVSIEPDVQVIYHV